ncbi:MAG TPA: CehA/McbA family metallohydrolase [Myxococcota bacterium]|jgi:hypothetical protein|nr:CehA/McbA family metallohydrolase [Myxococcota bacterium]
MTTTFVAAALALLLAGCRCGPRGESDAAAPPADAGDGGFGACTDGPASARVAAGPADLVAGPMAIGLPGDFVLENDHLRVVIEGPGRNVAVNPYGGNLLDADVRRGGAAADPGRDALGEVGLLVDIVGTSDAAEVTVLSAGGGCAPAAVRARGTYVLSDYINPNTTVATVLPGGLMPGLDEPWPLDVQVDYVLAPDDRHVTMLTTLTATAPAAAGGDVPVALGYLVHGGRDDAFLPGAGGFESPLFGAFDFLRFEGDGVAYALVPVAAGVTDRLIISIGGAYVMFHDAMAVQLLGFPSTAPVRLAPGASVSYETWFVVGGTLAEVEEEAARARGAPACVHVRGLVQEEDSAAPIGGADVSAIALAGDGTEGDVLTHTVSDAGGEVELCLRGGAHVALVAGQTGRPYAGGGPEPARVAFDVPAVEAGGAGAGTDGGTGGGVPDFVLPLPRTGALAGTVVGDDGLPLPARLTVLGVDPSPPRAVLHGTGRDPIAPGVVAAHDSVDGTFAFTLEPGDYDVVVTRGPEYSLVRLPLTVAAGAITPVAATLHRVLDTTGYLSGDLHVHAQMSPDSTVLHAARVANAAAEGVEVIVSTDQAFLTDYEPVIGDVGAEPWITSIVGEEVATPDYGHFNLFPLVPDPLQHNRGANDFSGRDVEGIIDLRPDLAAGVPAIAQINHPRALPARGLGNYFTQIDLTFDATGPHVGAMAVDPVVVRLAPDAQLLSERFDTMEVMTWANVQGLSDWFNFLNAGVRFTATGNSDTHTVYVESSGWPRNFIGVGGDDPATLSPADLAAALRAGASTVSFGPFLTIAARPSGGGAEVGLGGTLDASAAAGAAEIVVRLQAADWVDVDRIDLYENGVLVRSEAVAPALVPAGTTGEMRFELELVTAVAPLADAWYVAVATGTTPLWPGVTYNESDPATLTLADVRAGAVAAPLLPFAVTNPVWIDADGDGALAPSFLVLPEDWPTWRALDRTDPY